MKNHGPCQDGKVKYKDKKMAKRAARSQENRHGVKLWVYKCGNHFHLTHRKPFQKI